MRARGALKHDDRLDALAMAVGYWTERMAVDASRGIKKHQDDLFDADLRKFWNTPAAGRAGGGAGCASEGMAFRS